MLFALIMAVRSFDCGSGWINFCGLSFAFTTLPVYATLGTLLQAAEIEIEWWRSVPTLTDVVLILLYTGICAVGVYAISVGIERVVLLLRRIVVQRNGDR